MHRFAYYYRRRINRFSMTLISCVLQMLSSFHLAPMFLCYFRTFKKIFINGLSREQICRTNIDYNGNNIINIMRMPVTSASSIIGILFTRCNYHKNIAFTNGITFPQRNSFDCSITWTCNIVIHLHSFQH